MATAARGWPSRGWAWRASPTGPMPLPCVWTPFFDAPVLGGDVAAMYLDDRGGAWIAAADGQLNHIAAGERTARTLCETAAPAFAFTADAASVYCATPGEVVRVGKQNGKVDRLPGGAAPLTAIVADSVRGAVYAGSRSGELYRVVGRPPRAAQSQRGAPAPHPRPRGRLPQASYG